MIKLYIIKTPHNIFLKLITLLAMCFVLAVALPTKANEPCTKQTIMTSVEKACNMNVQKVQIHLNATNALKASLSNKPTDFLKYNKLLLKTQMNMYNCNPMNSCPAICTATLCKFCKRCSDYSTKIKTRLGNGWIKTDYIDFKNSTNDHGEIIGCHAYPATVIHNTSSKFRIRAFPDKKTGSMMYAFPPIHCSKPTNKGVQRKFVLAEHGVLVTDQSYKVRQYPGQFLLTNKKRSISYKTNSDNSISFTMANNIKFHVSSEGKITSNLFKSSMFDSKKCTSRFVSENGKSRSYSVINYLNGAEKKFIKKKQLIFGSVKGEKRLFDYVDGLPRQALDK